MASRMAIVSVFCAVVFAAFVASTAGETPPPPPPPEKILMPLASAPNGAERAKCITPGTRCYQVTLTCPNQCKKRSTLGAGPKACFMDCGPRCEAICKHRKPNCYSDGAICYDPRLVGGDGTMFYFHGEKDQDFCLVSDRNLHINGHFIGLRPEGRQRDYTWIQSLGLMFKNHKFSIGAKRVSQWDDEVDQLLFSYDGLPLDMETEAGNKWTSEDGQLIVERTYKRNAVEVIVDEMLVMLIQVVPITQADNLKHNYQLPSDDVFAHLDIQFKFYHLSSTVNGIMGQTYQPDYVSSAKTGVMMPILGGEDRFITSGLLSADCAATQFSPDSTTEEVEVLAPFFTDCSSKNSGTGVVCRR